MCMDRKIPAIDIKKVHTIGLRYTNIYIFFHLYGARETLNLVTRPPGVVVSLLRRIPHKLAAAVRRPLGPDVLQANPSLQALDSRLAALADVDTVSGAASLAGLHAGAEGKALVNKDLNKTAVYDDVEGDLLEGLGRRESVGVEVAGDG